MAEINSKAQPIGLSPIKGWYDFDRTGFAIHVGLNGKCTKDEALKVCRGRIAKVKYNPENDTTCITYIFMSTFAKILAKQFYDKIQPMVAEYKAKQQKQNELKKIIAIKNEMLIQKKDRER